MQLGDFHFHKAMALKRPVQLNIAACQLKQARRRRACLLAVRALSGMPAWRQ